MGRVVASPRHNQNMVVSPIAACNGQLFAHAAADAERWKGRGLASMVSVLSCDNDPVVRRRRNRRCLQRSQCEVRQKGVPQERMGSRS